MLIVCITHIPGTGSYAVLHISGIELFQGTLSECEAYYNAHA